MQIKAWSSREKTYTLAGDSRRNNTCASAMPYGRNFVSVLKLYIVKVTQLLLVVQCTLYHVASVNL
jgi:hypothetical protein